jgi:(1->4)-alpha-D-glucan 1-alpha-D-glucosylmutase
MSKPSEPHPQRRLPVATYRLQFNAQFTFAQAEAVADYLSELGISDYYTSPLFQAGAESTHGYDVSRFDKLNPNLGSASEFERLSARLRSLGMGLLLDMVPNHMGSDLSNRWWLDVLEHGRASPYAAYFDIHYQFSEPELQDKVLLPVLEDHYAQVLEAGKLRLVFQDGRLWVAYYEKQFPLSPSSSAVVLKEVDAALKQILPGVHTLGCPADASADPNTLKGGHLTGLLETLERQDLATPSGRDEISKIIKQLQQWHNDSSDLRAAMDKTLQLFNGVPGAPQSYEKLDALLRQQHYRLAYWRVGPEEINYRRFFDISELVSLRMELRDVFEATHEFVLRLLKEEKVTGLRIDHPDGLWDPKQYFRRIQESDAELHRGPEQPAHDLRLYVVAEKILTASEPLCPDWQVDGTTGYDFLNQVNGLFVDRANEAVFSQLWQEFANCKMEFASLAHECKKRIVETSLLSELTALTHRLKLVAAGTRAGLDFTLGQLQAALTEIITAFPVYRTYINDETTEVLPPARDYIAQAIEGARSRNPNLDATVIEFIRNLLLLHPPDDLSESGRWFFRRFIMRFQQLTGPVMAKGVEDTAFYRFNRLISLNEVGGNPSQFGTSVEEFHRENLARAEHWPHSMLATATHDTKRGEDARARINVLSEMPEEWRHAIARWRSINEDKKTIVDGTPAPDANDEYFFYQTLCGAWPFSSALSSPSSVPTDLRDRLVEYVLKAIKESKTHTTWTDPNQAYEQATQQFVEATLANSAGMPGESSGCPRPRSNPFLDDFEQFHKKISFFGQFNSLSQVLLKMTSPGVPDFYQGAELWDFNLVDPDNRRPVDYEARRRLLNDLKKCIAEGPASNRAFLDKLLSDSHTGQIKLYLIWRTLEFRRSHRELFERGRYLPLLALGAKQQHVCAFARVLEGRTAITIAPRSLLGLASGIERAPAGSAIWQDTLIVLPGAHSGKQYRNVLTGEMAPVIESGGRVGLRVADAIARFPVALLALSES